MLTTPAIPETHPHHRFIFDLCKEVMLTTDEVASHFRLSSGYLRQMRRAIGDGGIPFVRLPSGKILYRLSEVLSWEMQGESPHLTVDRVTRAISSVPGVTPRLLQDISTQLNLVFYSKKDGENV